MPPLFPEPPTFWSLVLGSLRLPLEPELPGLLLDPLPLLESGLFGEAP
jgi:hypothetical protein